MNKEQFDNTLQRVNELRSKFANPNGQSPLTTAEIIEYSKAIRDLDAGLKDVYKDLPLDAQSVVGLDEYVADGDVTISGIEENIKKAHKAASDQFVIDKAGLEAALKEKQAAFEANYNLRGLKSKALTSLNLSSATVEAIQSVEKELRDLASESVKLNNDRNLAQDEIDQFEVNFQGVASKYQSQLNSVAQLSINHCAAKEAELKAAGKALSDALAVKESITKRVGEKRSSVMEMISKPQQGKVSTSPLGKLLEDPGLEKSQKTDLLHALCIPTPGVETSKMIAAIPRKELENVYQNIIDAYRTQLNTVKTSAAANDKKDDLEKVIELLASREFSSIKRGHDNTFSLATNAKAKQGEAITSLEEVVEEYKEKIEQLQGQEANEAVVAPTQVSSMPGWMSNPALMTAGVVAIAAVVAAAYNAFSSPAQAASTVASSGLFSSVSNMTAEVAAEVVEAAANIAP